ncbi:hypothetical protein PGN35_015305 [Nodosilinea sp. PGN35]|uniref:hypothetical protein n=1 Tax=Nodosilinea sp. PGN35 TaxID=3020489 RepID=UPI0023B32B39|nr:hypothetical protein [Nodosilinea sp. TSF1-S3]MDF0368168.1 hypothetical protein [Nodosilinea sp. TSF1-S3]
MKRKSRPLITGGLMGLAGLGLLPRAAEAAPEGVAIAPDPALGAALAEDPHPVVVPAPTAQIAEPQVDDLGTPQPAWTPEGDAASVAAAAAPLPAAAAPPEPPAANFPVLETPVLETPVSETSVLEPPEPAPSPGGSKAAMAPPERLDAAPAAPAPAAAALAPAPDAAGAIASPAPSPVAPASASGPESPALAPPTVTPAETIPAEPLTDARGEPRPSVQVLQRPAPISAAPALADPSPGSALVAAPSPAVNRPAVAGVTRPSAAPRQTPPDVATLRSRATTVQALLRDLRTAYGLESSLSRPSQPETLARGPQLPPLPARSGLGRSVARGSSPQTEKIAVASPASAGLATAPPSNSQAAGRGPQLPSLPGRTPARATATVALALPVPQPTLSTGRVVQAAPPVELAAAAADAALPAATVAQTPEANQLRDELRVAPLTREAEGRRTFPPSPNAGIPSAFGANWGDVFFSASLAGADRLRPEADGSLSMGFGLGDSRRVVGVELAYNLLSVRRFGENGGFDAKVHRQVYSSDETQVAAAIGLNNFASYGPEAGGSPSSLYGVVTAAHLLQPDHPDNRLPITASVGLGGGSFSGEGSDVGVIAGVGLQVHPQFSINTAWSGVGVNVGASIVPVSTLPLTLNLLYGDVGNNTRAGSVAVLSIGYGFNFGPRF